MYVWIHGEFENYNELLWFCKTNTLELQQNHSATQTNEPLGYIRAEPDVAFAGNPCTLVSNYIWIP
jgi:hypothetical protein